MKGIFSFFTLLFFILLHAQERPPIQVFEPKAYGAENQNWSISQSNDKFIYVANNKGLLEFNGAVWNLYASPNETIMRSVNVIDDLIYTGCYREFGYWEKNEFGSLDYTSLSQNLEIPFLDDEEIWNIIDFDEWILFQSFKRIYILNKKDNSFSIIDSETSIYKVFKVNETIYYQNLKKGIYKIENGKSTIVIDDSIVKENRLVNMFYQNGYLLIETEDNGFFIYQDDVLKKWDIPANNILQNISVYRSLKLRDNTLMLGTISDGIFHMLSNGEIDYQINNYNGLSNNTVQSIFEDVENNIWLGLNNGINCLNAEAPLSIYNEENGKIGTVHASCIFNDNIYLGSNQGLFYRPLKSREEFIFVEGTQGQVWSLNVFDNKLFCGHDKGTFIVNEDIIQLISDVQGAWNIIPVENKPEVLLQGNYDGLYVLEKANDNWELRNKIDGFDISSKFFEMTSDNTILVSHEYKGVFKIEVNPELTETTLVSKDTSIQKGLTSSLIRYNKDVIYANKGGVYKYVNDSGQFLKDTLLSQLLDSTGYNSRKLVHDTQTNTLWSFSPNSLSFISPSALSSELKLNHVPLSETLPKGLTGYENISHLSEDRFLIGAASGYVIIDFNRFKEKTTKVNINDITISDQDVNEKKVKLNESGEFDNNYNNIEFSFSVPEYDKYLDTEYQFKLEGIDNHWSRWTKTPTATFKYLPFGDYEFKVRAKVGNKLSTNRAKYSFKIQRPFLLSNIAVAIYLIALWLFSLLVHNLYKRYYKKQREKLLLKTQQDLELKELENQKQLMEYKNDKLKQDIENKNRELGISTMNLIKKNEFLNNIKKELKSVDNSKCVKDVVKIIDKNLNNTDDWNLFEEAFNNADKDFLKKIKGLHPTLTSNDLRLCAYLRLNLSSKEIAPLLNISSRSVEVKRYRLRKKMGLEHESSLTDYILEI
jgi:DNA-binding CsgD family transcriptional regulator